jgi:acyl-coenzyme A thioesterase PaaI-like protein/quercetin dioxygenase-like cupin family protein
MHMDTRPRGRARGTVSSAMDNHEVDLKRFEVHGDVRRFPKGRFEVVQIGGLSIGRATYEPGWRWSEHVGPSVGATRCPVEHVGLVVTGAAAVAFDDGDVVTLRAGELFHIPPIPHDSWVVGDEQYVSLHLLGASDYAAPDAARSDDRDEHCFVCGWANPKSLGVAFERDPSGGSRTRYVARPEHEGWPGLLHGGVLFSLLDDAAGWAARFAGRPCVTSRASIRFRQSVPTDRALTIDAEVRPRGRVLSARATASRVDEGDLVAEFEALLFPRRS